MKLLNLFKYMQDLSLVAKLSSITTWALGPPIVILPGRLGKSTKLTIKLQMIQLQTDTFYLLCICI